MFFIFLLFYYVYFFHDFNSGQKREKQQTTLGSLFTATGLLMRVGHASNWMKNQDGLGGLCGFISMRQASQWIVIPPFFPFLEVLYREHRIAWKEPDDDDAILWRHYT